MPSLALRALMVGRDLENQLPNPRDTSLYHAWSTRLATAMMITHLPSPHVSARTLEISADNRLPFRQSTHEIQR